MYNAYNRLKRIEAVQEVYAQYKNEDTSDAKIYRKYIKKQFHIAISTYYKWLAEPVKKELKKIEDAKNNNQIK